jgi:GTP pyrophosphokinase
VTIPDVAKAAGVSTAAAGRALGGYGYVSDEVRERVLRTADELGYQDWEHVLAALGRGDVGPSAVINEVLPEETVAEAKESTPGPLQRLSHKLRRSDRGVRIQGLDNLMVRYSQCCQPVPGDDVIGYVTAGRGVSIHRQDCPNVLHLSKDPDRRMEIEWTAEQGEHFFVKLHTRGTDRRGLLSDIAKAISATGTDIQQADIRSVDGGMVGEFVVEVRDLGHLTKVMKGIGQVKGVLEVERRESFGDSDLVDVDAD